MLAVNRIAILSAAGIMLGVAAIAHEVIPEDYLSIPAVRTSTPPIIDGVPNDDAWVDAPVVTNFITTRTNAPSEQQTFVRLLYDDENLYVLFECIEDPETIIAQEKKYDRSRLRFSDDNVSVRFDTFNDHKQTYVFTVNALGTRADQRNGVFGSNSSWDAFWDAEVTITHDRWFAEMAIPIGVMHLDRGDNETWGVNFNRTDRGSNAFSRWSYHDEIASGGFGGFFGGGGGRGRPRQVADFGHLVGLDLSNLSTVREPLIETYASATVLKRHGGNTHTKFATGVDVSMRLTNHWVGTFTLNPDFGQVEADEGDIQLRDTERRVSERRPFFNEGAELFSTPITIYESRRIVDIAAGAKITGTGKDWTLASLVLDGDGSRSGNDAKFLVGRYTRTISEEVQLGAMLVAVDREDGYNWVGGLDTRIDVTPTIALTSQLLMMRDKREIVTLDDRGFEETTVNRLSEYAFEARLSGGTRPFFWGLTYRDISAQFDPDLGFVSRRDIVGPSVFLSLRDDIDQHGIESYFISFSSMLYQNHDGDTVLRDFGLFGSINFMNDIDIFFGKSEDYRRPFNNSRNNISVNYNRQDRWHSVRISYGWGEFQDVPYESIGGRKPWKVGDNWTFEVDGTFRRESPRGSDDRDIWLVRLESEYNFPWEGRLKLTWEETGTDEYNRALLFTYEDVGDWDFYFVINDGLFAGETVRGAFTKFVYRW